MCCTAIMIFQKLAWAIFLQALLYIVAKTEDSLITDFRRLHEYANVRPNVAGKRSDNIYQHSKNMVKQEDPYKPVKQVQKCALTTTAMMTKNKLRLSKKDWFEANKNKQKSSIQFVGQDNRQFELKTAAMGKVGNINGVAKRDSQSTALNQCLFSTSCRTRGSVITVTKVGVQTIDPNLSTERLAPFTPRTRTAGWYELQSTTAGTRCTKKWKCHGTLEDEPATDELATIGTLWQVYTLPTRRQIHRTPNNPITKGFLRMTSTDRWRIRPADRCTKSSVTL